MLSVGAPSLVLKDTQRRDQLSQMTKGTQSTPAVKQLPFLNYAAHMHQSDHERMRKLG